ncbi:conserved hypothetical protein [Coccidioides posadasii str. Silveira]|uniref:Uncharacterized protein n=2 Tax=Coccidioides posadasii TaxID=199306 RepID=E9DI95_COCPS|nr:conserved hypothetical protein [Coccidioides posadasii str. Silveira]KMM67931.1 hypothetical protein CPAG_04264 [Coccidioides posadasii RMSCC 3488]
MTPQSTGVRLWPVGGRGGRPAPPPNQFLKPPPHSTYIQTWPAAFVNIRMQVFRDTAPPMIPGSGSCPERLVIQHRFLHRVTRPSRAYTSILKVWTPNLLA